MQAWTTFFQARAGADILWGEVLRSSEERKKDLHVILLLGGQKCITRILDCVSTSRMWGRFGNG